MSFPKKIKTEGDSILEEDQLIFNSSDQPDYSTIKIKNEPVTFYTDEDLQYHQVENISNNVAETNPVDEIQIKTEITVEASKVEMYSEFETRSKCDTADASALQNTNSKPETDKNEFSCKFCEFSCGTNKPLLAHTRKAHPNVASFRCGICRRVFKGTSELEKHVADAHQGLGNECSICLTQYREDQKTEHKTKCVGRQLFDCVPCNMSFLRKEGLWKHLDGHGVLDNLKEFSIRETRIKNIFFRCEICEDDRAYLKDPLRQHAKEQHGGYYLTCPDCGKYFDDGGNRTRHMKKHCRVGPARERFKSEELKCPECFKPYQNRAALEAHKVGYHRKNPYQCSDCQMVFSTGPKLRQHKINIHMEPNFSCSCCLKKFKLKSGLQRHLLSHQEPKIVCVKNDGEDGPYKCNECEMKFSSRIKLQQHKVKIHMKPSLSCSYCSKMFKFKSALQKHITMHQRLSAKSPLEQLKGLKRIEQLNDTNHHEQENQDDCNFLCIESETDKNVQQKHDIKIKEAEETQKKSTHVSLAKKLFCKFCDFGCANDTLLLTHIREAHPDLEYFRRSIYRIVFNGTSELDRHVTKTYQLRKECSICLTQCRNNKKDDHKSKCLGLQLFICDQCKTSFLTNEGLLKHLDEHDVSENLKESSISETRTKEQFISCEICRDYRAYARDTLREHAKEQHNGHSLLCPDCGKTFIDSSNRKSHMLKFCRIGPARERFQSEKVKCPECSKSIKNSITLENHMARYHRQTPYECDVCEMIFSNGPKLRQHKVKIHMESTISCSCCSQKFKLKHELKRHMKAHENQNDS